jgi:hypothetical protein
MSPDMVLNEANAPPHPPEPQGPPLKVLVVSPPLVPGNSVPAPVEFANALVNQGLLVMFAAAAGPLRLGLSRGVGYLMIDDADSAPVKTAHELSRLLKHHAPDVVHSHGARSAVVAALAIKASRLRCARVMTLHPRGLRRLPRWIKGPIIKACADRYFAVSDELKSELERLGVPSDCILVESPAAGNAPKSARDSIAVYKDLVESKKA